MVIVNISKTVTDILVIYNTLIIIIIIIIVPGD